MLTHQFLRRSLLPVNAATAFRWHERPGALERLIPPWEHIEVLQHPQSLQAGSRAELQMHVGPISQRWVAEHAGYQPDLQFQDIQVSGPFRRFEHTHRMEPRDGNSCWLEDRIDYTLPGGVIGSWLGSGFVARKLHRVFQYRHAVTLADLSDLAGSPGVRPMKVLISGANGLVGSQLCPLLTTSGHTVARLSRGQPKSPGDLTWNPDQHELNVEQLTGFDGIIHLAGENIAGARWTPAVKERIQQSRVQGTRLLCESIAKLPVPPKVLVCASAIGYYGNRGAEILTEDSEAGTGFLAETCGDWEAACAPAREAGVRVVNVRIGVVLSPQGGALQKMLLPFRLGAGGVIGNGEQYWSWVDLGDLVSILKFVLTHEEIHGPVNATAPEPVTNREFTRTLGKVLNRPTIFPVPAFAAKLALGEMANELLLSSARVMPQQLLKAGYQFRCPTLESSLRFQIGQ